MRTPTVSLLAISLFSTLALAGCDDKPPAPSEVRARISSDLGNVLRELNAAIAGGDDALPGSAALAILDRALDSQPEIGSSVRTMTQRFAGARAMAVADEADSEDALDVDALIAELNDKLFTDANHLGDGIYQVPPSLVCAETTVDPRGNPIETIDAACAEELAKIDLRIRTDKDGDALVFAIQVDADHDEPLLFTLTHTSLAITVDLDDTQRAVVALARLLGEDVPNAALSGQATARLAVLGTARIRVSATIDRAISIQLAPDGASLTGPDAFELTSAKAAIFALDLDGNAKAGSFEIGLRETAVKIPDEGGRVELDLPGVTALASFFQGGQLDLTHVGLGNRTTTVSINGARALAIDLNAQDGRAFNARLRDHSLTGDNILEVTPRLDLQVAVDHAVIGDEPPVYDVTRVVLDGSLSGSDGSDQVEVLTGSFSITTDPSSYGFAAAAGQCVTARDAIDPATGAAFTQFTVGACQ